MIIDLSATNIEFEIMNCEPTLSLTKDQLFDHITFEKLAPARKVERKYNNETPNKKAITIDR